MKSEMTLSLLLGALTVASNASGAKLGDPAAPLAVQEWIKGKAVDVTDGKNVYVVEFWATWCGPCRTSIPHLTELQAKFKDKGVVFIGVSDETSDKVKPFVEQMGAKMDYLVGLDTDRKTSQGYMGAYGQNGIPTAFVVGKDKKVLWFGHPMADLEKTLQAVVDGKYDLQAAIKRDESRVLMQEFEQASEKGEPRAKELGQKLLQDAGTDVEALNDLAFGIAAKSRSPNRDFALAEQALDQAAKAEGKETARLMGTRSIVRFESGKKEEGLALAKKAVEMSTEPGEKRTLEGYVRVMETRLKK